MAGTARRRKRDKPGASDAEASEPNAEAPPSVWHPASAVA